MSIIPRILGLTGEDPIPLNVTALLIERRSALSRCEARLVVLDLLGFRSEDVSDELGLSPDSVHTYWKRVYRKTELPGRAAVRTWAEAVLDRELGNTA